MIDTPSLVSSFLLGNGANFTQNPGQEGWSRPQLGHLDCGSTRADQHPINTGRETRSVTCLEKAKMKRTACALPVTAVKYSVSDLNWLFPLMVPLKY